MQAHANDLRSEIKNDWNAIFGDQPVAADEGLDRLVHGIVADWRQVPLRKELRLLCEYAEAISRSTQNASEMKVRELIDVGWSEKALLEAVQVTSYFNYINRMAEGLGIEPETEMPTWGRAPDGDKGGTL